MSNQWTTEQVLALAPDAASASAGKGLANPGKWVSSGQKDNALWGECQGSGSKPYQVVIDLGEPAFKCSCPSRKFPCKHGIGLMLMLAADPAKIKTEEPPAWMADWLKGRQQRVEKKEAAQKPDSEKSPEELAKVAADQAKRQAARDKKVTQGLNDLDLWLRDLVRQGFGSLPSRPLKFWDDMAARMVDAQAPGVARRLRDMAGVASSGEGWQERLLEQLGLLYLLLEGYKRVETLPEAVRYDVRDAVGYTLKHDELVASQPALSDLWYVAGQHIYDDDLLRVQRAYLVGVNTSRFALVVNYAPLKAYPGATQQLDTGLIPGAAFEAELVFHPGAHPLRADIKSRQAVSASKPLAIGTGITKVLSDWAATLAANPWTNHLPALLAEVVPFHENGIWFLRDSENNTLPVSPQFAGGWQLLATCGGHPVPSVVGEWDGKHFLPVNAIVGDRILSF